MKNLIILLVPFVIGGSCLFGQEELTFRFRPDPDFHTFLYERVYAMKYPFCIRDGQIFDYHTNTFPDYLANDSKGMPKDSKPFGFTSNEEYICYFKSLDINLNYSSHWSQIILRSAKDGTIRLIYPLDSRQPPRVMAPKIPILSSQGDLVAMLANNRGVYRRNLEHIEFFRYSRTTFSPRLLEYLLIVDIESGKTLHIIPTSDCYNSKATTQPFESKKLNTTPRWPDEDLALFMPNDSGILVRQSCFQIDLYDFDSKRTVQSFNVLKIHGVKWFISTFMFTEEGYLRTFLHSSGPHLEIHSDSHPSRKFMEAPTHIDWDIKTGEIVREGGIPFPTD